MAMLMLNNNSSSLEAGMQLLTVSNEVTKPQDAFLFRKMNGVDKDGKTIRIVDMVTAMKNNYFVFFFFPMDFRVDSSEVISFKEHLDEFTDNHYEIVGVTSDATVLGQLRDGSSRIPLMEDLVVLLDSPFCVTRISHSP